jgi:hypothetical protein|tara:strand:- start:545 stop:703 length:159 start_codon:yes stop_codon:yes gene_type:complete
MREPYKRSDEEVMPIDFWNYLINPITGFTYSVRDNITSSKQVTEQPTPLSLR